MIHAQAMSGKSAYSMSSGQHQICAQVNVPGAHHAFFIAHMQADNEHFARQQHAVNLATSIYRLYTLHLNKHNLPCAVRHSNGTAIQ